MYMKLLGFDVFIEVSGVTDLGYQIDRHNNIYNLSIWFWKFHFLLGYKGVT